MIKRKNKQIILRVDDDMHNKLSDIATMEYDSVSNVVRGFIRDGFKRMKKGNKK